MIRFSVFRGRAVVLVEGKNFTEDSTADLVQILVLSSILVNKMVIFWDPEYEPIISQLLQQILTDSNFLIQLKEECVPQIQTSHRGKLRIIDKEDRYSFNDFLQQTELFKCEIEIFESFLLNNQKAIEDVIADALEHRTERLASVFQSLYVDILQK